MSNNHSLYYRIYDTNTGTKVAEGYAEECAEQLNINRNSFYAFVFRMNENRKAQYRIETEAADCYIERYHSGRKGRNLYSVIKKNTNELVVRGSASECAESLSITIRAFYDLVSRAKKGIDSRYNVVIDKVH